MVSIGNEWDELLQDEFKKEYYLKLREFLKQEYKTRRIYPNIHHIFNALKGVSYSDIKVVILGQDPYHGPNQAHGLAFSVQPGVEPPPSLQNIFAELHNELGCYIPNNGYLVPWTEQGVLLLNTVLTVRAGLANSHRGKGWEIFTDRVIELLNDRKDPVIFLLWGANAAQKQVLISNPQHFILKAPHPSPLSASRGFFGCGHFRVANQLLQQMGKQPINWQIPNLPTYIHDPEDK